MSDWTRKFFTALVRGGAAFPMCDYDDITLFDSMKQASDAILASPYRMDEVVIREILVPPTHKEKFMTLTDLCTYAQRTVREGIVDPLYGIDIVRITLAGIDISRITLAELETDFISDTHRSLVLKARRVRIRKP